MNSKSDDRLADPDERHIQGETTDRVQLELLSQPQSYPEINTENRQGLCETYV